MDEDRLREVIDEFVAELMVLLSEVKVEADKTKLSNRTLTELAYHEGVVCEAYKDSKGIWTWGVGVTNASGHKINRYVNNPQPLEKVLEIYEWLLRTKYLPDVLEAFEGHPLTEEQLAAALSFHYNTGAIKRASWVKAYKNGFIDSAKKEFMLWNKPAAIIGRRMKERDLFFDGVWSNKDGKIPVYTEVNKPSYTPKWSSRKLISPYGNKG